MTLAHQTKNRHFNQNKIGIVEILCTFVHMDKERKTIKVSRKVADKAKKHCDQNHIKFEKWCSDALIEKIEKEKTK